MTDQLAILRSVWDAHPNEASRRDNSHWRGIGRWSDDEAWRSIGASSLTAVARTLRFLERDEALPPRALRILEWGPGGGANAHALRHSAGCYFGIDISKRNLDECQRMMAAEGCDAFRPVLLSGEPDSIADRVVGPIDLFLSTAVFQHFPDKDYGAKVLRAVRAVCGPETIAVIQIRFDNGDPRFAGNATIDDYVRRPIFATSYRLDEFWSLCGECGFRPLFISEIAAENNYAIFHLQAA